MPLVLVIEFLQMLLFITFNINEDLRLVIVFFELIHHRVLQWFKTFLKDYKNRSFLIYWKILSSEQYLDYSINYDC